jgi:methyltransferase (TIGR00027 family)
MHWKFSHSAKTNDSTKTTTGCCVCRQVLIVAAGYDTLALRLSNEFPTVHFWEVDHPATSKCKQRALAALGQPKNLHTVAADLTQLSLHDALLVDNNNNNNNKNKNNKYDPNAPTVVVMEGLLMYLTEHQVQQLFNDVSSVVGPKGSSVCFDFVGWKESKNLADIGWLAPFMHWWLRRRGEPWLWGVDPARLSSFFSNTRWRVMGQPMSIGCERLAIVELTE